MIRPNKRQRQITEQIARGEARTAGAVVNVSNVIRALVVMHAAGLCTDHELAEASANVRAYPGDYVSDTPGEGMLPRQAAREALRLVRLP